MVTAIRPGTRKLAGGKVAGAGGGTGVLDVDEQVLAVRRRGDTGDFLTHRANQETAQILGDRVASQHLVIAKLGVIAAVHDAFADVGLDPEHATVVEPKAIRAVILKTAVSTPRQPLAS